jgi:hypothetical protein
MSKLAADTNAMRNFLFTSTLLIILVITNCCKPGSEKKPEFQFEKGFGRSTEHPVGVPFAWPAGLRVLDKPATEDDCFYDSVNKNRLFGHGAVLICLNLYNETPAAITVRLPPGFMLVSKSLQVQNMLLINTVTIVVPPREQYFATLIMICVNIDRESPYHDDYEDQPIVTDHPALRELAEAIRNKKCNFEDYGGKSQDPNAMRASELINSAVHDLIYGKPVKDGVMAELLALPDR